MSPASSPGAGDARLAGAAVLTVLLLALPMIAGQAQQARQPAGSGNAVNGRRLAEALCASCHVVDRSPAAGWTDAPSFPAIAAQAKVTQPWLREFFARPHLDMLQTDRSATEVADLSAYILSLKPR